MKHFRRLLPLLILALVFSGCAGEPKSYTYTQGNVTVTVDPLTNTITDGTWLYTYTLERSGNRTAYVIDYPNGAVYHWTSTETGGAGGWSEDYDGTKYLPGEFLVDALDQSLPRQKHGSVSVGLILMGTSLVGFFLPELPFYLRYGWAVENAEPSDQYITWSKAGGVLAAVLGLVYCII